MRLTDVRKKGKVIVLDFEDGWSIIVKLGMVGWLSGVRRVSDHLPRTYSLGEGAHLHEAEPNVVFEFGATDLHFTDFRNFGTLTVTHDQSIVSATLDAIAPDILDPATHMTERIPTLKPTATIETVLMDQTALMSGIGNIIKSELLYAAGVAPKRTVASIQPAEWRRIFTAARTVANRVLDTLKHRPDEYEANQRVYQRETDPHGRLVKSHVAADGRRTFWVPAVQH
jgi:formamidopyrimidine-DNA glycosylase